MGSAHRLDLQLGRITTLVLYRQSPLNLHQFCLTRDSNFNWRYYASIRLYLAFLFIMSMCLGFGGKSHQQNWNRGSISLAHTQRDHRENHVEWEESYKNAGGGAVVVSLHNGLENQSCRNWLVVCQLAPHLSSVSSFLYRMLAFWSRTWVSFKQGFSQWKQNCQSWSSFAEAISKEFAFFRMTLVFCEVI